MATTKAEYFMDEMTDWKRTVAFQMGEIYVLTVRLAEVIRRNSIPGIAIKAEKHQDKLNMISERFHRLQLQFRRQEAMLRNDTILIDDSQIKAETESHQRGLRQMIYDAEKEFIELKKDCQNFLAGMYNK